MQRLPHLIILQIAFAPNTMVQFRFIALAASAAAAAAKISPDVLRQLELRGAANVVFYFESQEPAVLASAESDVDPRTTLVQGLVAQSLETQAIVNSILHERIQSANQEFFFIDNSFQPEASLTAEQVQALAKHPKVTAVALPVLAELFPIETTSTSDANTTSANQWGVDKIAAPAAWAKGHKGKGIVVANIDTGVRVTHAAVKSNWRSDFGWFDPDGKSTSPKDYQGHGSHTMGSIAGQNGVGVAPEAQWIACVGCTSSGCPQAALTACAEWMLCPKDAQGNKNCKKAPHVINNSWGSNNGQANWFEPSLKAWRAAGIIPVFSNGNNGRTGCGTVGSPGVSTQVIGVGATDISDALADFSSRGPTFDKRIKPDVSAPGKAVMSIDWKSDSALVAMSGTSMAAPHVTGAVAVYLSANPGASYDQVLTAFTKTADTDGLKVENKNCGGVSDAKYPNNNYGFGRINVAKAIGGTPSTSTPSPATETPAPATSTATPVPATTSSATPTPTTANTPATTSAATPTPTGSTLVPGTTVPTTTSAVTSTPGPTGSTRVPATSTATPTPTSTGSTRVPATSTSVPTTTGAPTTTPSSTGTTTTRPPISSTVTPVPATTKVTPKPSLTGSTRVPITSTSTPTTTKKPSANWNAVQGNVDYDGFDLGVTSRASASSCYADCEATAGCKLFVWTNYNAGTCWLKHTVGPKSALTGAIASSMQNTATVGTQQVNVDFWGGDLDNTQRAYPDLCIQDCRETENCVGYVWNNFKDGTCWLKSELGYATQNNGAVAGTI
ncbi:Aste57867_20212 [Aphanomyces stellatus]|uniref:subtilisin n=1 Tax=Aphanomyces stellatus TaxID=120398 RepID=A0A485LEG7_9STRA|nr:hypothetical protein As57867_020146 [Aphanomyces stellatus]VFT96905.1 Aste57867_20212 [Aphanomyces stellatus]